MLLKYQLIKKRFLEKLLSIFNTNIENATNEQIYYALSMTVNEFLYINGSESILKNSTISNKIKHYDIKSDEIIKRYSSLSNVKIKNHKNFNIIQKKLTKLDDLRKKNTDKNIIRQNTTNLDDRQNNIKFDNIVIKNTNSDKNLQYYDFSFVKKHNNSFSDIIRQNNTMFYDKNINKHTNLDNYHQNNTLLDNLYNLENYKINKRKTVHYLSIEFLIGKSLKNNLWRLKIDKQIKEFLAGFGKDIEKIYDVEDDAGLGNGGLGRLAACYLESLANCHFSAVGHSIMYEYGLFKQKIIDGKQNQFPDNWLSTGSVWLTERNDKTIEVSLGGKIVEHYLDDYGLAFEVVNNTEILAVPFDYVILSRENENISTLRLWQARAKDGIDLRLFDNGEFDLSLKNATSASVINKILYPNDSTQSGKDLRLIQQYFLVSAVIQSVFKEYFEDVISENIDKFYIDNDSYKNEFVKNEDVVGCKFSKDDFNKNLFFESEKPYKIIISILKDKNLKTTKNNVNKVLTLFKKCEVLDGLSKKIAIHINDTHPSLSIPEILRVLIDDYHYGWDESYDCLKKIITYTNHTILSESLEVKRLSDIERIIPRIALILKELDKRFKEELFDFFKNDYSKIDNLSIISGDNVYMANLAVCVSHSVNGVSKIHSEILKTKLFKDYNYMFPNKFLNVTNGISFTRWLSLSNENLTNYLLNLIGDGFIDEPTLLKNLEQFENDEDVINKISEIKFDNKVRFSKYVKEKLNIDIDPTFRFDVQAKRIHEYKRQLMNIMKVIYLMEQIKKKGTNGFSKQVFIFAGKSASSYKIAKRIIQLINSVAKEIDEDETLRSVIKVVFVENYNITMAEMLMPATEVSEQISVAGREASGTGNMKAVLNGALMLCTSDGANIEICEKCGRENMFEFGLKSNEVERLISCGYNAMEYYEKSEKVRLVISKLKSGIAGEKYEDIASYLMGRSSERDVYMCLADFESYVNAYYEMDKVYLDKNLWNKKVIHSISNMGYFSSDRSIKEYAYKIWKL